MKAIVIIVLAVVTIVNVAVAQKAEQINPRVDRVIKQDRIDLIHIDWNATEVTQTGIETDFYDIDLPCWTQEGVEFCATTVASDAKLVDGVLKPGEAVIRITFSVPIFAVNLTAILNTDYYSSPLLLIYLSTSDQPLRYYSIRPSEVWEVGFGVKCGPGCGITAIEIPHGNLSRLLVIPSKE